LVVTTSDHSKSNFNVQGTYSKFPSVSQASKLIEPDIEEEPGGGIPKIIPVDGGSITLFTDFICHDEKALVPHAEAFLKMVGELRGQIRREFKALSVSQVVLTPH